MRKRRRTKLALAMGAGGVALAWLVPTTAQDIRISVTGTNIKRVDAETAAPIETITRGEIEASGLQTISEVLRQITANNNGSISASFYNGFSASGAAVSLRGLGPNNTLLLVNGRRMANFGLADDGHASYVDIQQIPFDAVERIEVLKDGASAIYGTDAVAGVINVILRQTFTGVAATATAGTTYTRDGNQYRGAITAGYGDLSKDRFNAFVSLDAQKQDAMPFNNRRAYIGSNDLRFMGLPDTRPGNPNSGYGPTSLLGNVRPVNPQTGGSPGAYQALPGECAPSNQDGNFCRFEPKDFRDQQPQVERFNAYARGAYAFSDAIQGYAELSFFEVRTELRTTPTSTRSNWYDPSTHTIKSATTVFLPVGHPDNPFNAQKLGARLYYSDARLGPVQNDVTTGTQRYLVGLKGTHADWDWDVAGLYIRSDTENTRRHLYTYDRLLQGIAGTGPYGYYRIGANAWRNDPAIYAWISPDLTYHALSQNTILDAKASRDLYRLDGGPLALAIGYEFRREELDNPGLPGTEIGNIVGIGNASGFGSRNVNAVYAELYAPLRKDLEVTAAARFDDYSDIGGTLNPKVGIKWNVLPSLVLRGTWASGFRAPGLYETSTANATGGGTAARDPVRCPVTGLPADCNGTLLVINTGNPDIKPERSQSWTVGLVAEPVKGLSATLDYWNFETRDQITIGSSQAVLNNPASFPNAIVARDDDNLPGMPGSGRVLYISTPYQNANTVQTDGLDLDVLFRFQSGETGRVTAELQWTHVFNYKQTFANGQTYNYVGTQGNYDVSSAAGTPQDRANLIVGWDDGPWKVTGTIRYVSDYQSIPWQGSTDACLSLLDGPDCHVSSFTTLDVSASYSGFRDWQVFGSIVNVFNRIAPFNPAAAYGFANYNYNYAYSGGTGTQFNLGFRYTFK